MSNHSTPRSFDQLSRKAGVIIVLMHKQQVLDIGYVPPKFRQPLLK